MRHPIQHPVLNAKTHPASPFAAAARDGWQRAGRDKKLGRRPVGLACVPHPLLSGAAWRG